MYLSYRMIKLNTVDHPTARKKGKHNQILCIKFDPIKKHYIMCHRTPADLLCYSLVSIFTLNQSLTYTDIVLGENH